MANRRAEGELIADDGPRNTGSGTPEADTVSLREFISQAMHSADVRYDERMDSLKELIEQRARYSEEAVKKVEAANEKRFESVNEFRGQLKDQANSLATRVEMQALITAMTDRIERVERTTDARLKVIESASANMAGRLWALGAAITVMVFLINIAVKFIPTGTHP